MVEGGNGRSPSQVEMKWREETKEMTCRAKDEGTKKCNGNDKTERQQEDRWNVAKKGENNESTANDAANLQTLDQKTPKTIGNKMAEARGQKNKKTNGSERNWPESVEQRVAIMWSRVTRH